jgi:hypothetical protein
MKNNPSCSNQNQVEMRMHTLSLMLNAEKDKNTMLIEALQDLGQRYEQLTGHSMPPKAYKALIESGAL